MKTGRAKLRIECESCREGRERWREIKSERSQRREWQYTLEEQFRVQNEKREKSKRDEVEGKRGECVLMRGLT